MVKNYTTQTASLKTTFADVRKLDVKKIKVNNKDVATSVKHPNDTREVITENDLWGSWAEIKDGEIIFHDDEVVNPNASSNDAWNYNISKVENNKAYIRDESYGNIIKDELYGNIQTENIKNGHTMFQSCHDMRSFNSDLKSLVHGESMFWRCDSLSSFTSDLNSLTNGESMFSNCWNLTTFHSDLSSLIDGESMFSDCYYLTTFDCDDLSSLTNGDSMFSWCSSLTNFTSDLSSLTNGNNMFYCTDLSEFSSSLENLVDGTLMFSDNRNLSSFISDLSSLECGATMFYNCKLDTDSLIYIAETIKDVSAIEDNGEYGHKMISIGIGNSTPTAEEIELLTEIHNKGWRVFASYNHEGYEEFSPTTLIPTEGKAQQVIPFYAKPIEVDEKRARYVGEDGKFYNISGGNLIFGDDLQTYGLFASLEDAAANMRLTPYKRIIKK